MKKSETFVSVVLISDNQSKLLMRFIEILSPYLHAHFTDYEILIIDQCSQDDTELQLHSALKVHDSIRYLRLSQKAALDVAIAAGLENSIGDFVINLNIAFDSCSVIEQFITQAKQGSDIVIGTSNDMNSLAYKCFRAIGNRIIRSIGYSLPNNSTGSFCLSRQAVNTITDSGRFYCKLYMRMANLGYAITAVAYNDKAVKVPKKTVVQGIKETLHHMVFNSTKPLRWMSTLGLIGSLAAMVFSLYSLIVNLVQHNVMEGWTTTILFMSFMFAILFIMLSFFGEYLARLLDDRSEHKEYNVLFEKHSSVMVNEERQNVLLDT